MRNLELFLPNQFGTPLFGCKLAPAFHPILHLPEYHLTHFRTTHSPKEEGILPDCIVKFCHHFHVRYGEAVIRGICVRGGGRGYARLGIGAFALGPCTVIEVIRICEVEDLPIVKAARQRRRSHAGARVTVCPPPRSNNCLLSSDRRVASVSNSSNLLLLISSYLVFLPVILTRMSGFWGVCIV